MQDAQFRILQISDIHLFANQERALLGVKTQESFDAVLNLIKANNHIPDLIILSGDLAQDGLEASYIRVADRLKEFPVPIYCIPGNHDDSDTMQKIFPLSTLTLQKQVVLDKWQIILLDSHKQREVEGFLTSSELDFMQKCLNEYPDKRAIIAFHHQPIFVNCAWLDRLGLTNADELWKILRNYPQVDTILFGHVHQEHEGMKNEIKYYSTPSTCIQFKKNSDPFALEELNPGYRVIDLYPNGDLITQVHRVANYIGKFEENAKGY